MASSSKNALITADEEFEAIRRFMLKELMPRFAAMRREIVKSISENAVAGVRRRAPSDLGGYEKDLVAGQLGDELSEVYGIVWRGKKADPEKGKDQDRTTTLLYIKREKRKTGKWTGVFRILSDYGPFTLDTWPVKIPKDLAMIYYRRSDPEGVKYIRERNLRDAGEISSRLRQTGVNLSRDDFDVNPDNLDIVEDIPFKVARREKGYGVRPSPHWKPGIEEARSASSLGKIASNRDIMRAINDPNFHGWAKLGKIRDKLTGKEVGEIAKFQKLLLGV